MTVERLENEMTSAELSEWLAVDLFHQPLPNSWLEAGTVAAATIAPYTGKGKQMSARDFVPLARLPQTKSDMVKELEKLKQFTKG